MSKKLGFALGAGGARGLAHIGFIKAMEEAGIEADFVAGTSMGSVIGACYCSGMSAETMHREISDMTMSDLFDLSINPFSNGALLRSQKMRKKLETYFLQHPKFKDLKKPFECVAVDLNTGNLKIFSGEENIVDGVTASCTVPGIFKPCMHDGMTLIDGGIKCRVPVQEVRDMGAEVIVAVDVLGDVRTQNKKLNLFSLMLRTYDVMDAELTKYKMKEYKPDLYLKPELGDMDMYKFKDFDFAISAGYETGKASVKKIKRILEKK